MNLKEIRIGGRTIHCQTAEERDLLSEADAIVENPSIVVSLSTGRLMLIKDACQLYSLGKHQRIVNMAIERRLV